MCLEAESPQGLRETLAKISENKPPEKRFVSLNVYGPKVLVRQFDLPRLKTAELKNALRLEAVELLHLRPDEVELDYQVLYAAKDKAEGVFAAVPKKLLEEYSGACEKAGLTPVAVSARIIAAVDSFLQTHKIESNNFSVLLFAPKNILYLAGFDNYRCLLLREIRYADSYEAGQEIIESLRYFLGKSVYKEGPLYIRGEFPDKDSLITRLEKELNVKTRRDDAAAGNACSADCPSGGLFRINLLKRRAVSLSARKNILRMLNAAMAVSFLVCAILGISALRAYLQIRRISASYNPSDYSQALRLEKTITSYGDAK